VVKQEKSPKKAFHRTHARTPSHSDICACIEPQIK